MIMIYEVGYNCGDGIYSVNLLEGEENLCRAEAEHHASRFGYSIAYFKQTTTAEADYNRAKGMPWKKVC